MCVYCDLTNAFSKIDISHIVETTKTKNKKLEKKNQLTCEDEISSALSEEINNSSIQAKYDANYHNGLYSSQCCVVSGLNNKGIFNEGCSCSIDLQIGENWLIEAKFLGIPFKKMKFGLTYCANVDKSLNLSLKNQINNNTVLTDEKDGVVWADICRLLGVYQCSSTPLKLRLFQVFYVHSSNILFPQRLAEIYSKYEEIFTHLTSQTPQIEDYVITSGNGGFFHAWKAYPAKFECITFPSHCMPVTPCIPSATCTIPTSDAAKTIAPFAKDINSYYDIYLIEITPVFKG